MFGKKARRIAELEQKLKQRDYGDIERYNPLVADFVRRVDAEVAEKDTFLPEDLDLMLSTAEMDYRKQKFLELFNRLPIDKRMQLLLETGPSDERSVIIEEALSAEVERLSSHGNLTAILEQSRQDLRVDLSGLPYDSVAGIYLNWADDFDYDITPKRIKKDYNADIAIKAQHKGNGRFIIISIDTYHDFDKVYGLDAGSEVEFGIRSSEGILPTVFYNAQMFAAHIGRGPFLISIVDDNNTYKVSRVTIDNEEAFFGPKNGVKTN